MYEDLLAEAKTAIRQVMTRLRRDHPDETFYAFALWSDSDMHNIHSNANTLEALLAGVKEDGTWDDLQEDAKWSGIPFRGLDDLSPETWWGEYIEWSYESQDEFDACWRVSSEISQRIELEQDAGGDRKDNLYVTYGHALKDLRREGVFDEQIALYIADTDGGTRIEVLREINPHNVFCRLRQYFDESHAHPIWDAIEADDNELAIQLLDREPNLLKRSFGTSPLLHLAIEARNLEFAAHLLGRGVDVNCVSVGDYPALTVATRAGDTDSIDWLLDQGADINLGHPIGSAIANGDVELVNYLLTRGAIVPTLPEPWYVRQNDRHRAIFDLLREHGAVMADGVSFDVSDETAYEFLELIGKEDLEAAKRMLVEYPDLVTVHCIHSPMLYHAAQKGSVSMCRLLLEHGAQVDALGGYQTRRVNKDERETPLTGAAGQGCCDAARFLIENGADVNDGLGERQTPIFHAIKWGHFDMVELLIEHGADVNANYPTLVGTWTPLTVAKDYKHEDIAALLKKHGAKRPRKSILGRLFGK